MKPMAMGLAALMAITAIVPTTAMAQRGYDRGYDRAGDRGWDDRRDDRRGWDDRRDDRRGWNDRRDWQGDRGRWQDDRRRYAGNWSGGWGGNRYRGPRTQTVCRWTDGYYGPVKRCFRVRR